MNPYTYLQAKMGRFVLEFSQVKGKFYYDIDLSNQNLDTECQNGKEGMEDTSSTNHLYIFDLGVSREEDKSKPAFYIRLYQLSGYIIKKLLSTRVSGQSQPSNEVLADNLFHSIIEQKINPEKVIIKGINEGQIHAVRNLLNKKLSAIDLKTVPESTHGLHFYSLNVDDYVKKPKNSGAKLDTVLIQPQNPSGKYIINCAARGRSYLDWIGDMKKDADLNEATVIGFNYRGMVNSSGMMVNQMDAADDIIAQVKYLIEHEKVNPTDITLYGLCLGGALASLAAAELEKENISVKLYMSRSFKRFDQTIADLLLPRKYDSDSIYLIKLTFYPVLWFLTTGFKVYSKLMNWEIDVEAALKNLKPENIEYDFAEPSREDAQKGYVGDKIVLSSNSPYHLIQEKLHDKAKEQASRLQNEETDENLQAHIGLGVSVANLGQSDSSWTEEESLDMLLKLENVISDIEKDLKAPSLSDSEALQLQQELKQLQAIQKGLNLARVGTLLAHQVRRINPEERRWNPHACSPDKIAPYGFNGTQRDRLAWFVNQSPLDENPKEKSTLLTQQTENNGFTITAGYGRSV